MLWLTLHYTIWTDDLREYYSDGKKKCKLWKTSASLQFCTDCIPQAKEQVFVPWGMFYSSIYFSLSLNRFKVAPWAAEDWTADAKWQLYKYLVVFIQYCENDLFGGGEKKKNTRRNLRAFYCKLSILSLVLRAAREDVMVGSEMMQQWILTTSSSTSCLSFEPA